MREHKTNASAVAVDLKRTTKGVAPHILVIDDDQVLLDLLGKVLKKLGFQVALIDNGEDAVNLVRKTTPDVVLLDIKMPGMDGITILKEIKAQDPDIEVVIMTGFASLDSAIGALKYGAFDYIQKPFDRLNQVVDALLRAWERRRPRMERRNKDASLERRIYELKILYNLSRTVGDCLDSKEMIAQFLNSLSRIIQYDLAISIFAQTSESKELLVQVVNPSSPNFLEEAKRNLIDTFNSVSHSKISKEITFDRILGEENIKQGSGDDLQIAQKVKSFLNVPVVDQKNIVGMIHLSDHRESLFSPDDIRLVYTAISQMPSALHRLNQIRVAERSRLNKLAQSVSEGVIMIDENFEVVLVNQIAQNLLRQRSPTLESIETILGLDLRKSKAEMEKRNLDLIRKKAKINSENYEIIISIVKGAGETFRGVVISIHDSMKEKQD